MAGVITFLWSVVTLSSFVPALIIIARNRRHFEFYVGCFQLLAGVMFSASKALDNAPLLIQQHQWHFISDHYTVTYGCLLCVHLMCVQSEDTNIMLRYVAFTAALLAKFRDEWGLPVAQGVVVASFACACVGKYVAIGAPPTLNKRTLAKGLILLGLSLVLLAAEASGRWSDTVSGAMLGLAHLVAGICARILWCAVPCRDRTKKTDKMPSFV